MKKKCLMYITLTAVIAAASTFAAFAMTGDEAVAKMKSRIYGASTMRGVISLSYSSGEMQTGAFKYMSPGKFNIQFSNPEGKVITTNGKKLWVYDKADNVCGVQDVDKTFSGGIASFANGYLAIASPSGASDTIIRLKSPNRGYRDVIILVDGSF
ncbi:MAG: LolA family protein, partial [Spirochaetota bacterium]